MNDAQRRILVVLAEQAGDESQRGGAPQLTLASEASEIGAWLQWCDPNGCHTDDLYAVEFGRMIECGGCVGFGDQLADWPCEDCHGIGLVPDPDAHAYTNSEAWEALERMLVGE